MKATIQSIHFTADSKLIEYIEQKLNKLETFSNQIMQADVYLKLENEGAAVKDKVVEIRVHIPGNDLFAKDTSRSFEDAVDAVTEQLRRQVERQKEKINGK
jgi:putative sigma-54 modulation protein